MGPSTTGPEDRGAPKPEPLCEVTFTEPNSAMKSLFESGDGLEKLGKKS